VKKITKIFIAIVVLLLLVLTLALIFLPKMVPITKIANLAADKVETRIGRTISIEKVDFSIFSGIHLKKITLSNERGYSPQPMVTIKDVTFHYKLWPLIFKKKVVVKDAGINGMNLLVEIRGKSSNIKTLADKISEKKPEKSAPAEEQNQITKEPEALVIDAGELMDINISRIYFTNSNIKLINHNNESKVFEAKDIDFELSNLSTDLKYSPARVQSSVELAAGGSKTNIEFNGKLLDFTEYDLDLKVDRVAIDKLISPFVKQEQSEKKAKAGRTSARATNPNFDFFKNFKINFIFNLKELSYQDLKTTNFKAKAVLKDLMLMMESEAALYEGAINMNLDADLKQPVPDYHAVLNINSVQSEPFLIDFLDIKDFVSGALSADADISSTLAKPTAVNGFVNTTVTDGQFISGEAMGDVPAQLLKEKEGQGFERFFIEIRLKNGFPEFGMISMDEEAFNLNVSDISLKSVEKQVKQQIDTAIEKEKKAVEEQLEEQKDQAKQQLEKEAQNQLQNLLETGI